MFEKFLIHFAVIKNYYVNRSILNLKKIFYGF